MKQYSTVKKTDTNFCINSYQHHNEEKVIVWNCNAGDVNQRFIVRNRNNAYGNTLPKIGGISNLQPTVENFNGEYKDLSSSNIVTFGNSDPV